MPILVPNSSASDGLKDLSAVMICAQLNLTALDLDRNFAMIRKELQNAKIVADEEAKRLIRENKVGYETFTILALPDMTITGPGCGDAYLRPALLKATMARLLELERLAPDKFVITLGVPIGFKGKLYKANAFICDGALRGFSCATLDDLSPRDDLRQFAPWERDKIDFIKIDGRVLPIGDLSFVERNCITFEFGSFERVTRETRHSFCRAADLDAKRLYSGLSAPDARRGLGSYLAPRKSYQEREEEQEREYSAQFLRPYKNSRVKICRDSPRFIMGRFLDTLFGIGCVASMTETFVLCPALEGVPCGMTFYAGGAMVGSLCETSQGARFQYSVAPSSHAIKIHEMTAHKDEHDGTESYYSRCWNKSDVFDYEELQRFLHEPPGNNFERDALKYDSYIARWEISEDSAYEEFARAASLALFDYMRKCRANGFALSLSGGADSATIATLVRLGVLFGCKRKSRLELGVRAANAKRDGEENLELGVRRFLQWLVEDVTSIELGDEEIKSATLWARVVERIVRKFPKLDELRRSTERWKLVLDCADEAPLSESEFENCQRDLCAILLTTFYQSTRNSSEVTRTAAREIAQACGATHYEFDVDPIIEQYKSMVADALGEPWDWNKDDLALQNIQARGRGPSAWLVANKSGRLLLATGNRSEVACGYATMDGDTCGGLSPIAGIDKAFIRKWLVWMEHTGVAIEWSFLGRLRRFSIPALKFINDQQPTAELRPLEEKQTDEADLMPYVILNAFERALIRERLPFNDAVARVVKEAPELGVAVDEQTIRGWGQRFCKLWDASQWKRERYAPGFQFDDYDLAPTSWANYPYVSAGFSFEFE